MVKKILLFLLTGLLFSAHAPLADAGDILDRIVATVNGHIILQSDWDDAIRFDAFTSNKSLDQLTPQDRKATLDRLVDQELLREQMHSAEFQHATDQEVQVRINEIRKQYPKDSEQSWDSALTRYGLSEDELRKRVAAEIDVMRLIDAHLRPSIDIDPKTIESYYNQELLPQLRQSGAREVPLAEVTPKIKELLTQKKMDQMLVAWLQNLRSGSQIRTESPSSLEGSAQ
ncbi:MAG TPA: SurA N-terminal domain-containing protein [Terriglobales bacterium]|nr:SurA N-terminal domain-containing protein [Terriglobales bacterium]